VKMHLKS